MIVVRLTLLAWFGLTIGCGDKTEDTGTEVEQTSPFAETGPMSGMTNAHNEVRRAHGIDADLVWDESLAEVSLEWLEHLAANNNCQMEHNWDSPLGENLMWATYYMGAEDVVAGWASEEAFYDYDSNSCQPGEMCGHYTQIVWEDTERVGCAMIVCPNERDHMWMCNYDPAGNWVGERPY